VPHAVPSPTEQIAPDDLAKLLMASAMLPSPGSASSDQSGKGSLRKKLIVASLIAAIGIGASIMSCVGQSFSLRQARAMEGIEQQLKEIRASCSPGAPSQPTPMTREETR
jgi:hypothetical protein